jgi:formate dehydrogenase iron-sulfur subunit
VQPYFGWLIPVALAGSAVSFVTTRILANKNGDHTEGGHE